MIAQNIISGLAVGTILAGGNAIRRWMRKVDMRLVKIERLLKLNGRDISD